MKQINKKSAVIILSGLIIRIILMVSSCHFDLLSHYWYAHLAIYHKIIPADLYGGAVIFWPMFYVNSIWLFFIRPFIGNGIDLWPENWFLNGNCFVVNFEAWKQFVSQQNIHWILFLLKFPYLIMEAILIFLIIKTCSSKEEKLRILKFLIFNPISLFIIYIFGADDIFPVLFVVFSLFLVKKQELFSAALSLGFSAVAKVYTLFLLPLFIILISKRYPRRPGLLLAGFLPLNIVLIIAGLADRLPGLIKFGLNSPVGGYIFSFTLPLQHASGRIYPFVVVYSLLIGYLFYLYPKDDLFISFSRFSLICALIFYAFCFFHPQFFLLIVPLAALQISKERKIFSLFFIQAACFFIYTFQWNRDLSWRLFMPLGPDFFAYLPSPPEVIARFYRVDEFNGIFRSIFFAVSMLMIYLLMRIKGETVPKDES